MRGEEKDQFGHLHSTLFKLLRRKLDKKVTEMLFTFYFI